MKREDWPKVVTVSRRFTYDTNAIAEDWKEMNDADPEWDDVISLIEDWATEDLRSPISRHDVSYTDENGKELE